MIDAWRGLAYFESADYVADAYRRRHDITTLQTHAKSKEIATHLAQGRQYFEAANEAGDLSKPLLLYYGALALTRGLILFLELAKGEANLHKAHGVEVDGWERLSASKSPRGSRFDDINLTVQRGTFLELCSATSNTRVAFIPNSGDGQGFYLRKVGTGTILENTTFTLKAVLARIPQLDSAYETVFGELPAALQIGVEGQISDSGPASLAIRVNGTKRTFPDCKLVAELLGIPQECFVTTIQGGLSSSPPVHQFQFAGATLQELADKLPGISSVTSEISRHDRLLYVIAPFADGTHLSLVSIAFLIAHAMGTLVRYYPSTWTNLSMRSSGDRVFPLLRASMHYVDKEFPRMILDWLEDDPSQPLACVPNPSTWFDAY